MPEIELTLGYPLMLFVLQRLNPVSSMSSSIGLNPVEVNTSCCSGICLCLQDTSDLPATASQGALMPVYSHQV